MGGRIDGLILVFVLGSLLCPWLPAGVAQTTASPSPPKFPLASDYAPPGWPGLNSRSVPQRELEGLLRSLEAVAGAEVLVTGAPDSQGVKVLLKARRGAHLTPQLAISVADLACAALPGVIPERVTVVEASGRVLYDRGMAVTAPVGLISQPGYVGGLLGGALVLGLAGWWVLARRQRPAGLGAGPGQEVDFLAKLPGPQLAQVLAEESPQVLAVLLRSGHPAVIRRVSRYARSQGLKITPAGRMPAPEVWRVLAERLRAKSG